MKHLPTCSLLLPALFLAATACSGGGGGASGNAGASHAGDVGALTRTGQVAVVGTRTASVTPCTSLDVAGLGGTIGLALDSGRDRFYTHDFGREVLVRVDGNGAVRLVGGAEQPPSALTYDPSRGRLFGMRIANATRGELSSIDPNTGAVTIVGLSAKVRALAFDPANDALLGVEQIGSTGALFTIDPETGIASELFRDGGLASVYGLAFDPVTRTLYGVRSFDDAVVTIDLLAQSVTESAVYESASNVNDIAYDVDSGRLFGLTQGGEVVQLGGTWPNAELERLTVLSRRLGSMTFEPRTGTYFAVDTLNNELVSLDPTTGVYTSIGSLGDDTIESLVYDPTLDVLYGISVIEGAFDQLVELDQEDATRTSVEGAQFLYPAQLAIDRTTGTIYGYERERNVSLLVRPREALLDDRVTVFIGQLLRTSGGVSYIFEDLTWDDVEQRLIGVGTRRVDEGGGSTSFYNVVVSFEPNRQQTDRVLLLDVVAGTAIASDGQGERFLVAQRDQPLVELTTRNTIRSVRTIGGLWDRDYVAAVRADARETVYAVDDRFVYAIDPVTGATTWLGGQPANVRADDLLYDAQRDLLGLRDGAEIAWVLPERPSFPVDSVRIPVNRVIVADPDDVSILYGLSSGFVFRIDVLAGTTTQLNATALPGITEESGAFLPGSDEIAVQTRDGRLFRVDALTGDWTEVGPFQLGVRALFAN